jgi:adenylate cyclase
MTMESRQKRYDLMAIVFLFLLAMIMEYREAFSLFEDETLSYRQILRTVYGDAALTAPSDDVVIVYTDEDFYADYDGYPLTRNDLSTLIDRLSRMGAQVIGVDMLLDFKSKYGDDPTLERALREAGNVLMVSQAEFNNQDEFTGVNRSIDRFSGVSTSGYSNISANSAISQSIVRLRIYPEIAEAGSWPFSVKAVSEFLGGVQPGLEGGVLSIGEEIKVELDQFNDLYIDYPLLRGDGVGGTQRLHEVTGISATDILFMEDEEELEELSSLVEGRIALIGEVAEVAHDEFETPVGNVFGVEIIANTISTLLRGGPLRAAPLPLEMAISFVIMVLFLLSIRIQNPFPRNAVTLLAGGVYLFLACYVFVVNGLVVSMSYVVLASVVAVVVINTSFYMSERGQKALIRNAFGQYLSPTVVAELVKDPERLTLGGEERELTAYFSDIRKFSSFSEAMTPSALVFILNEYLTEMYNIVIGYEGTIDKFEGDSIMAFWGAPVDQSDHALRGCLAAIDMAKALGPLRTRFVEEGRPPLYVRMGVNTGPMVVGNMGSIQRMNYTIIGDAVNLASRLEGANKAYGSDIMISSFTHAQCQGEIDVRELDTIRVVGKNEPVTVYQLLERKNQTTGKMADVVDRFGQGLAAYKNHDYQSAAGIFRACVEILPEDGPSNAFLERCRDYQSAPPPPDWDGVFTLVEKG